MTTIEIIALSALCFVGICGIVIFATYQFRSIQREQVRPKSHSKMEDHSFIMNGYFNAAYDILCEADRHRYGHRR